MQPDLPVREPEHVFHQGVPVQRFTRQRGQDQERGFPQRLFAHDGTIYVLHVYSV
jgi:hypothetical protein